ncbi:UTRA domain-containing protein [Streptomyces sp. NPDC001709]
MQGCGFGRNRRCGEIQADAKRAGLLRIDADEQVLRIERLGLDGGVPMGIETTHLSVRRFPGLWQ